MKRFGKYSHIKRLFGIYFGVLFLFLILRPFLIPKSFGKFGHYRASSIDENINLNTKYADIKECKECHEKEYNDVASFSHKNLNCQICHGALLNHVENPAEFKPSIISDRKFCLLCHAEIEARPSSFKQIDEKEHFKDEECISCHLSHSPNLK